jgi:amino acid permease
MTTPQKQDLQECFEVPSNCSHYSEKSVAEIFGLTWASGAAILATYSVSSSTAFMPFIFGRLGYIVAPVLLALYFGMCGYLQSLLIELGAKHPEVRNMPDLASLVAGRYGRNIYNFLQISNQQLFMPTALWFVVTSLKKILYPVGDHSKDQSFLSCNIVWLVALMLFALVGANVQRRFGHAGWLCKLTCLLNVFQVSLIIARVYMNPKGSDPGPQTTAYATPSLPLSTDENDPGYWADLFTSASLFCYCYVPVFIATEAMQEIENKNDMQKALWTSTGCMFVLYTAVGLFPVLAWGWQRPDDVLTELSDDWMGRTANATLMIASGTDFLITAISLNQRAQETLNPDFDINDWSLKACGKWFCYSTPSLLVSFVMLCFIPKLASLSGLMTAFVVPFSQIMGPAVLASMAARKGLLRRRLRLAETCLIVVAVAAGVVLLVLGSSATIYSIFWRTTFEGNFFCDQVAG